MPKVILKNKTGLIDVTSMTSQIKWSGSKDEVARKLELDFLYPLHDYYTPKIYPNIGELIFLYDDGGKELFRGKVFYNERLSEQGTIQITCYDDAIRLAKSKGTYNFKNKTAEAITRIVCNDLGMEVDHLANTSISQKMLCSNMGMYEIIRKAYEGADRQNGKQYNILMQEGKLCVEEIGKEVLGHTLKSDTNILQSSYSENAEEVINKVKIYDEQDRYIGEVQNNELIDLLGIFQEVYIKEEDKQGRTVASNMLREIERSIEITIKGNSLFVSGKRLNTRTWGFEYEGIFNIIRDCHRWEDGIYITEIAGDIIVN